ncbi:MAG: MFS transporter [Kineosporiaceae bacterium]
MALTTLVAFEAQAVTTAMPVAARELDGLRSYGLAFSLFLATSLLGIVVAGRWTDRSGPRPPLFAGAALFAGGLLITGAATGFPTLLAGRAVSGTGGGLISVCLYVLVAAAFPVTLQPRVFAMISAAWVLPSLIGPVVAGWLAVYVSWRMVFLLVPPLLLLPGVALWRPLQRAGRSRRAERTTAAGAVIPVAEGAASGDPGPSGGGGPNGVGLMLRGVGVAGGAVLLQWGLQGAGRLPGGPVAALGAVLVLVAVPPLLPAGILRLRHGLPALIAARTLFFAVFFGAETFIPLMLVEHRGLSPALAGLALTAGAIGWFTGSWWQGRPGTRAGHDTLVAAGATVIGAGVFAMSVTALPVVPVLAVPLIWVVTGAGMGTGMSSSSVLVLRLSRPGEEGRNSSALQVADALGGVLGVGAAGAVFAAGHQPDGGDTVVYAAIWAALGLLGAGSALVARRIRGSAGPE